MLQPALAICGCGSGLPVNSASAAATQVGAGHRQIRSQRWRAWQAVAD